MPAIQFIQTKQISTVRPVATDHVPIIPIIYLVFGFHSRITADFAETHSTFDDHGQILESNKINTGKKHGHSSNLNEKIF
jgi:hypothetical protein